MFSNACELALCWGLIGYSGKHRRFLGATLECQHVPWNLTHTVQTFVLVAPCCSWLKLRSIHAEIVGGGYGGLSGPRKIVTPKQIQNENNENVLS